MLRLQNIEGGYGNDMVIHDVSVEVLPGSVVALLGPNGAGKTTLLKLASGLLRPKEGRVYLGEEDVTKLGPHDRAGVGLCHIIEGRGVFPSLTVRENLLVCAPSKTRDEVLDGATAVFPILGTRLRQVAGTLSGGEQQMLALARAYVTEPRIILVDEASLGLAPKVVSAIFDFLETLSQSGKSLLIVEQYISRALALADRVYVLSRGRVVMDGAPKEIRESKALLAKYLGSEAE